MLEMNLKKILIIRLKNKNYKEFLQVLRPLFGSVLDVNKRWQTDYNKKAGASSNCFAVYYEVQLIRTLIASTMNSLLIIGGCIMV